LAVTIDRAERNGREERREEVGLKRERDGANVQMLLTSSILHQIS